MTESENRVPCPHCQAANFPSSDICWQCNRPMRMQDGGESIPPESPEPVGPQENLPTPEIPSGPAAPPSQQRGDSSIYVILGFVFAGLGLLTFFASCCGWPFIIAGIVMGILAYGKGNRLGGWIIAISIIALIANLVWIAYFFKNYYQQMGAPGGFPGSRFPGTPTPRGSGPFGPHASPLPNTEPAPH